MRALITGITGFVGSHLAELLLGNGEAVTGISAHGKWRTDVPSGLVESTELLAWDVSGPAGPDLRARLTSFEPDVIFHFAAISIPFRCGQGKPTARALDVNVGGTRNVIELAESLPSKPRLILASTCHVYAHVCPAQLRVDENSNIDPVSAYGMTKLASEELVSQHVREGNLDACIVRGFHHIGTRQPSGLMLSDWLDQLADPRLTQLHVRCRESHLDLIDVRDAARAYDLLAKTGSTGEVYNLGSGCATKSGDVLDCILTQLNRQLNVVEASPQPQWNPIAITTKLCALGWQVSIPIYETISDMLACLKLQQND